MWLSDNAILLNLVEVDCGFFNVVASQLSNHNVYITSEFDTVENFGLVCIVSVWTWISLNVF